MTSATIYQDNDGWWRAKIRGRSDLDGGWYDSSGAEGVVLAYRENPNADKTTIYIRANELRRMSGRLF